MNYTQQMQEFLKVSLQGDAVDPRSLSIKSAALNFVLGLGMLLVVALHIVIDVIQIAIGLLLQGYDLIVKGLKKLPSAETPEEKKLDA